MARATNDWRHHGAIKKAIVILLSLFFMGCSDRPAPHFKLSGETMGTSYHITIVEQEGEEATDQQALKQAVEEQLQLLNQQMSTYLPNSELSKLSRAPFGEPVLLSNNLFDVLMLSLEVGWLSNGAFDITVAPLVDLWGFGPGGNERPDQVPPAQAIARAREQTGFQFLEFDLSNSSVIKQRNLQLDLSGIAKGFAVDKIAELFDYAGYDNYMVEIGGELRLKGVSPRGQRWRIAIEEPDPTGLRGVHRALAVTDKAMATSGDYRNYFEQDGQRFSHTIDPATGYPINHTLASVTVIADSCAYADALATALEVMGPVKGMQFANQHQLAVYMIIRNKQGFDIAHSEPFAAYMEAQ